MKYWIRKTHLWLGLISGVIVFIVALTGCIYCFQNEIQNSTQPYRFVTKVNHQKPPSELIHIAQQELPTKHAHSIKMDGRNKAAVVSFYEGNAYYFLVYLHPETGQVLKVKDMDADFFRFILNGHFYLWLPAAVGQPVVAIATLIFTFLLISGLILWWPKKNNRKQRFTIKQGTKWRRKNYDLHAVGGFYLCVFGLLFALTGLVWGFAWFSSSVYFIASGGKSEEPFELPSGTNKSVPTINAMDMLYYKLKKQHPESTFEVHPAPKGSQCIEISENPDPEMYWKINYRYFDASTLKELHVKHTYGLLSNANGGDFMLRMNYDLHTGQVFGLTGKIILFFASLGIASLPITGFIIYFGRKFKNKRI